MPEPLTKVLKFYFYEPIMSAGFIEIRCVPLTNEYQYNFVSPNECDDVITLMSIPKDDTPEVFLDLSHLQGLSFNEVAAYMKEHTNVREWKKQ